MSIFASFLLCRPPYPHDYFSLPVDDTNNKSEVKESMGKEQNLTK